jgi:hypothetical protein
MPNYRNEIPLRALLNAAIVDRAIETPEFERCVREVLTLAGSPGIEYQFKNPAFIVGFLYCAIVVPKEIWISSPNDPVYQKLEIEKVVDLFDIRLKNNGFDDHPTYFLIHRLRNAVAHANFEIDQSQSFLFQDRREKHAAPFWEAWISNANLFRFLNALSHAVEETYPVGKGSPAIH